MLMREIGIEDLKDIYGEFSLYTGKGIVLVIF